MDLGIVYAMPMEGQGLTYSAPPRFLPLQISDHCTVIRAGIGDSNACRAATVLRDAGVDALLSWGCAAGLDPDIEPGTVVVPTAVLGPDGRKITVDQHLHSSLCKNLSGGVPIRTECSMSSDSPVVSRQQKAALYQRYAAVAVDMESAAIALAARSFDLPFAAVRVVLDPAGQALPEAVIQGMEDDGSFAMGRCLRCLLNRPADLLGMVSLAMHSWRARRSLQRLACQITTLARSEH
jgi:adenosylhomocysteine nucleosidase